MKVQYLRVAFVQVTKGGMLSFSASTWTRIVHSALLLTVLALAQRVQASGRPASPIAITCPADAQLQCGDSPDPAVTGIPTVSADCGGPVTLTFVDNPIPADCTDMGVERTWTAAACGKEGVSCVQTIIFLDKRPPEFLSFPVLEDFVPCGWPIPTPPVLQVTDECDPSPSLVLTETQSALSSDGSFTIYRLWTATDRCGNSSSQGQMVEVQGCVPSSELSSISGLKYYDSNVNGVLDEGEAGIAGWKMVLTGGPAYVTLSRVTDSAGQYRFDDLQQGMYLLTAVAPDGQQWQDTTASWRIIVLGEAAESRDFGAAYLGGENARPASFWADKAGFRLLTESKAMNTQLEVLRKLNLRDPDGSAFDPASYNQLKNWLLTGNSSSVAYLLSREVATMVLNINSSSIKGSSKVRAPGAMTASALGYAAVESLVAEANVALADPVSVSVAGGTKSRAYQSALQAALGAANNDQNFVQALAGPVNY